MSERVVVIGASAGGVETLKELVSRLPAGFGAPVVVVLHIPSTGPSVLPAILARSGALPAVHARNGEPLRPAHIYVAPPDHHLLVDGTRLRLSHRARENGHRPAVDPMFRTAAETRGVDVIAVVLSGALDDGAAGVERVKQRGGTVLVQDPAEALVSSMPLHAIDATTVDAVLPIAEIASHLVELAGSSPVVDGDRHSDEPSRDGVDHLADDAILDAPVPGELDVVGSTLSDIVCPDCGGNIWEREVEGSLRFRCRVGHAYSLESMLAGQDDRLEEALWAAYRALVERAAFSRRLERRYKSANPRSARRYAERALESEQRAETIAAALSAIGGVGTGLEDDAAL